MSDEIRPGEPSPAVPEALEPELEAPTGVGAIFGPFLNAILAPGEAFRALDARPRLGIWVATFVAALVAVTEVIKLPATLPASIAMARQQIEAAGGEVTAASLSRIEFFSRLSAYAFTPVWVFLLILGTALVFWVIASLMGAKGATFGRAFALASAGAVIKPFLNNIYIAIVLRMNPPVIRRPQDMIQLQPSLGLDLFAPTADLPVWLTAMLKRVDLFSIWWIVVIAAGAVPLMKMSKGQGRLMAIAIWVFGTIMAVVFTSLFAS